MIDFSCIDFSKFSLIDLIVSITSTIRGKDFCSDFVISELKSKVEEANFYISSETDNKKRFKKLLYLFYVHWNFTSSNGLYKLSDSLCIDNVLKHKQGTAISLGIIFFHISKELNFPISIVLFPTQLILKVDWSKGDKYLIDPFNGQFLNNHILEAWLKGNISPTAKLNKNNLKADNFLTIIKKILNTFKTALMEEKKMDLALIANKILLQITPNDPYEIRDRGLIYSQLDCDHIALADLIYFIEHCPEDPISEIIKIQIHSIEQKKVVLH
ncbi:MAG: tetratricopeptide repeat protein [Buchnera aphidicola (Tetraneura sorini)]